MEVRGGERVLIPKAYKFSLSFSEHLNDIKLLQQSKGKPSDLWNNFRPGRFQGIMQAIQPRVDFKTREYLPGSRAVARVGRVFKVWFKCIKETHIHKMSWKLTNQWKNVMESLMETSLEVVDGLKDKRSSILVYLWFWTLKSFA